MAHTVAQIFSLKHSLLRNKKLTLSAVVKKQKNRHSVMVAIIKLKKMNGIKNEGKVDHQLVKGCWSKIKSTKGSDFFIDNFY